MPNIVQMHETALELYGKTNQRLRDRNHSRSLGNKAFEFEILRLSLE